jgi:hypothetical protein
MNTYEKAQHGADMFLDADAAREGSFAYYAVEVLENNSEPSHELWTQCVKGAKAKFYARRAAEKGITIRSNSISRQKDNWRIRAEKWQLIKAGIVQFHLDQIRHANSSRPRHH